MGVAVNNTTPTIIWFLIFMSFGEMMLALMESSCDTVVPGSGREIYETVKIRNEEFNLCLEVVYDPFYGYYQNQQFPDVHGVDCKENNGTRKLDWRHVIVKSGERTKFRHKLGCLDAFQFGSGIVMLRFCAFWVWLVECNTKNICEIKIVLDRYYPVEIPLPDGPRCLDMELLQLFDPREERKGRVFLAPNCTGDKTQKWTLPLTLPT